MADTIKKASVKILVVVDDVDRVQPKDLLLLMKTIRLLGRFPRVNYLLAYDRKSTIKALASALGSDTSDAQVYMEKIVQYPLDLPDPQQHFLRKIIGTSLEPIVAKASQGAEGGPTPQIRFESFYTQHMAATLTTPRACHRYAGQARTFLQIAQGDVDPADFFALTFIRIFYPDLYRLLPSWREDLTRRATSRGVKVTSKDEWIKRIETCGYEGDTRVELMEALASLFPHAFPDNVWGMSGGKYRANDSDYFDRYFTFSLPAGDMSDAAVVRDLERIRRGELTAGRMCQETFDHPNEQMQLKALKKGTRHTDHKTDERHLIEYLTSGLSLQSGDEDFRSTTLRLRSAWLADVLWHCEPWERPEVAAFVRRFPRPSVLGYCLNLLKNRSESALAQATPGPGQTLLQGLAAVWNQQATEWLLEDWRTTRSNTSVEERFTVWEYLVVLDGLDDLQSKTSGALRDGSLALTTLAAKLVMASTTAGDYQAQPSSLTLFMDKLENTVPPELLMALPLHEPEVVPTAQGEEVPSPAQLIRFAYDEIIRWREYRAEAPSGDGSSPEG